MWGTFVGRTCVGLIFAVLAISGVAAAGDAEPPELILHNGRVVTVDEAFSIHEAVAVRGERVVAVGSDAEILETADERTRQIDLEGRMVLPGLMDSHVHPGGASMYEFDHEVPSMRSVEDVLAFVRERAEQLEPGAWIRLDQVFITRLEEQRYPTRAELDEAAPENPVFFRTGPDASLNTLALAESGIDADFEIDDGGPGHIERDSETGEPTGILRSSHRYVQYESPESTRQPSDADRYERLRKLLRDYASVGLTSVGDRSAGGRTLDHYAQMLEADELPVRVAASRFVQAQQETDEVLADIDAVAEHPLHEGGPMLRVIGIKVFLDGGMLTGSAYMREPWGVSDIYDIDDPEYRGLRFIPEERLVPMVRRTVEQGMQFTAHSVGDGAVHALLDAYEQVNESTPIAETRPSITHSNFMSEEAVQTMAKLGVVADIQPAWLYRDGRTLMRQFGEERMAYFQPLRSLLEAGVSVGGGSDHMQKIGSFRAVNPYNPFLGMWITMTRRPEGMDGVIQPEQMLSREQALRFYTIENARVLRQEDVTGSIEPGKLADMIVIDRDFLDCPIYEVPQIQVLRTFVGGREVYAVE